MNDNLIITIGRQLGSGGKEAGRLLSEQLGIKYYDKELILLASQQSGVGKEFFEQADEKTKHGILSGYFGFRSGLMTSMPSGYMKLSNETLFKIQSDVIRDIAEKESCIFVGRCADYILRDYPNLTSVFICANLQDRVKQISGDQSLTQKEATSLIEQTDKKRAGYYNYFSDKTWGMASSYDLCVNSSVYGIKETSEFILNFVTNRLRK